MDKRIEGHQLCLICHPDLSHKYRKYLKRIGKEKRKYIKVKKDKD